jgi:hypothetical protein
MATLFVVCSFLVFPRNYNSLHLYNSNRLSRSIQDPHPLPHRNPSRRHHLPNQHRQPTPPGTDAVIMVEDTHLASTDNETEEGTEVETLARIPVGENVRLPGSNVRRGDNVMLSGDRITGRGREVGSLVFIGREKVCFLCFGTPILTKCRRRSACIANQS